MASSAQPSPPEEERQQLQGAGCRELTVTEHYRLPRNQNPMKFKSTRAPQSRQPQKPRMIRRLESMLAILTMSAGCLVAPSAGAVIAIQDATSPIQYNGGGGA